jgi:hypothetical protein
MHLRTAATIICANDLLLLFLWAAKGYQLYMATKSNPAATGWFVMSAMMLVVGVIMHVLAWYGLYADRPLCILPKLVLKLFVVAAYCASLAFIAYLVYEAHPMLTNLVTDATRMSTRSAESAVKLAGTVLCMLIGAFVALQLWFYWVLLDAYRYVRTRQLLARLRAECANGTTVPELSQPTDQFESTMAILDTHYHGNATTVQRPIYDVQPRINPVSLHNFVTEHNSLLRQPQHVHQYDSLV